MHGPQIALWQHEQQVDLAPLVRALHINVVWTDDPPYDGQGWEETHLHRALRAPGVHGVIAKIERLQWGQTHEGSVRHAAWIGGLARTHPEILGLYLNDFYDEIEDGFRTRAQWQEIIDAARGANADLPLWVPHYPHRGNERQPYDFDYQGVVFNLWDPAGLPQAEQHLVLAEAKHAGKTIVGGLYLSAGPEGGRWLTEAEFRDLLGLYVRHVQAGALHGLRFFCACQFAQRPEYADWAQQVLAPLIGH